MLFGKNRITNIPKKGIFAKLFDEMVKLLRQFRCGLLYKSRRSFHMKLNELQIVGRRCRMFNFDEYMVVFPNAKINIGLFVTGKRPDGFHNLETVFYPIELRDILEITEIKGERGSCVFTSTGRRCLRGPPHKTHGWRFLTAYVEIPLTHQIKSGSNLNFPSYYANFY